MRPTQIDVDDSTDVERVGAELLSGSAEDETAWRDGQHYAARLHVTPLQAEERQTAVVHPERDGMRLQRTSASHRGPVRSRWRCRRAASTSPTS